MKHLILSGLVETWPVSQSSEPLFVSNAAKPWSAREHPIINISSVHPSIWRNNNSSRLAELDSISEIFLSCLSRAFSRVFKLDWDDRAWRILLGPFTLVYVHTICDRLWTLESITSIKTPYLYTTPDFNAFHPLYKDEHTLNFSITSDHLLNHYLYSQIIKENPRLFSGIFFYHKSVNLPHEAFLANQVQNADLNLGARNRAMAKNLITSCVASIKNPRIKILPGLLPFSDELKLVLNSREIGYLKIPSESSHIHYSHAARNDFLRDEIEHIFTQECSRHSDPVWLSLKLFLGLLLPVSLVEVFQNYCYQHLAIRQRPSFSRISSQIVVSQYDLWWNSAEKLSLAQSIANGAKLIYLQHGGYGSEYFSFYLKHELDCAHLYLSWCLTYDNIFTFLSTNSAAVNNHIEPIGIPAPPVSPRLSRIRNIKAPPKFLLICAHWSLYSAINPNCGNIDVFQSTIDACIELASGLTRFKPSSFSVRLCKMDHGIEEESQWLARAPHVSIIGKHEELDSHISLHDLCVYTYNGGTGWYRFLLDQTPFVLFFDPVLSPPSKVFEPVLARFESVGLFHDSPHKLAAFINEHGDSILDWYSSQDVVEAIEFCKSSVLLVKSKSQYLTDLRSRVCSF
jgi:putative transferase (TIGR04331 family)